MRHISERLIGVNITQTLWKRTSQCAEPRGKEMQTCCYVDADHAGCHATRRSYTGIILYAQSAPLIWYSKKQNTVETSTFGSEFIAAKIAVKLIEGLCYKLKLRMMGVVLDGPTGVFCDNESIVINSTQPESCLKKKHNAITYHHVRESQVAGTICIAKEDGKTNLADGFTKCLARLRHREIFDHIIR